MGHVAVWHEGWWEDPVIDEEGGLRSSPSTPLYRATGSWHDQGELVDAFWGPSVHWNTNLDVDVMLLNRAKDSAWTQEGIYVAFAPVLEDPEAWSAPRKILHGGRWYPQVVGLEIGEGTDAVAGATARLFMAGESRHLISFARNPEIEPR